MWSKEALIRSIFGSFAHDILLRNFIGKRIVQADSFAVQMWEWIGISNERYLVLVMSPIIKKSRVIQNLWDLAWLHKIFVAVVPVSSRDEVWCDERCFIFGTSCPLPISLDCWDIDVWVIIQACNFIFSNSIQNLKLFLCCLEIIKIRGRSIRLTLND